MDPIGPNMGMFPRLDPDQQELPEEVRQALENRGDAIHSPADLRDAVEEEKLKR